MTLTIGNNPAPRLREQDWTHPDGVHRVCVFETEPGIVHVTWEAMELILSEAGWEKEVD